jgi:hypothetical protein
MMVRPSRCKEGAQSKAEGRCGPGVLQGAAGAISSDARDVRLASLVEANGAVCRDKDRGRANGFDLQ